MFDAFEILADPGRRLILDALLKGERSAGDLVDILPISQPGVSKHLRLLREAGMVRVSRDARRRMYSLSPERFAELEAWLEPYRAFWAGRLDDLETHLNQEA